MVEAFENDIVHPFQRSDPDSGVSNYLRDELHDGQHDVRPSTCRTTRRCSLNPTHNRANRFPCQTEGLAPQHRALPIQSVRQ